MLPIYRSPIAFAISLITVFTASCYTRVFLHTHPTYKLLNRFEMDNLTEGRVEESHGICLDRSGNIIVTDPTLDRVYRYTPEGKFLNEIGFGPGTELGSFDGPRDAKVDSKGRIYIVDGNSGTLLRFDPGGKIIAGKAEVGTKAKLNRPHALDLDASGHIYVADVDNRRVAVYDEGCRFLMDWSTPPVGMENHAAPHGIGVDPNGDVFVVAYSGVCFKYTGTGELLFSFAETGATYHAMCTDRWGNVYLAARGGPRKGSYLDKYNNNGIYVLSIDIQREGKVHPVCLAVDMAGNLYVTDNKGVDILAPTLTETVAE